MTLRCWDPYDNNCIQTLKERKSEICCVTHVSAANLPFFATGHDDGSIRVWNFASGNHTSMKKHTNTVSALCFFKPPKSLRYMLASCSFDKTLCLFDVTPKRGTSIDPAFEFSGKISEEEILCCCYSHTTDALVIGSNLPTVLLWSPRTKSADGTLEGHTGAVSSVCVDEHVIISGSDDCTIRIWDSVSRSCINVLDAHTASISALYFLNTYSGTLISCSSDGQAILWKYEEDRMLKEYKFENNVKSACYNPYRDEILFGLGNGDIYTYKMPREISERTKMDASLFAPSVLETRPRTSQTNSSSGRRDMVVEALLKTADEVTNRLNKYEGEEQQQKEEKNKKGHSDSSASYNSSTNGVNCDSKQERQREEISNIWTELGDALTQPGRMQEGPSRRAWSDPRVARLAGLEPEELLTCI
eukprot:jgi/Bigna1/55060/estExt_Genewise1Plus.C_490100